MKKVLTLISTLLLYLSYGQMIIGDNVGTASVKTSVLLEFSATNAEGLILPYVRTLPGGVGGTLLLDASTATNARVKFHNGTSWIDLSGQGADVSVELIDQPTISDHVESKVIMGSSSTSVDGVLVLESTTKAMVLPIVTNINNIPSPSPGMMVYLNEGSIKRLAVFNGSTWSFWSEDLN